MAPDPILELRHVSKAFGHVVALEDVSLKAYAGSVLVIVGDNGAGKSTMIKVLAGVYPVDSGRGAHRRPHGRARQSGQGARARHRRRLPEPRPGRMPRRRGQHVSRPPAPQGALLRRPPRHDQRRRRYARRAEGARSLGQGAGRGPLRRPAPGRRHRPRRAAGQPHRPSRRADRCPGLPRDAAGDHHHPAAPRAGKASS